MNTKIEPNYSHYLMLDLWSTVQTACILCRLDPDFYADRYSVTRDVQAEITLRSRNVENLCRVFDAGIKAEALISLGPTIDSITMRSSHDVRPRDILRFAAAKNVSIPDELSPLLDSVSSQSSKLEDSGYWASLTHMAECAVIGYPSWKEKQGKAKIRKTGNLQEWLVHEFGVDSREAEVLKKVLSDVYKELK